MLHPWWIVTSPITYRRRLMDKDAWRQFLRWLDDAGDDELAQKHVQCLALQDRLTDKALLGSLGRIIHLIEEEHLIRLGIRSRMPDDRAA
jgi:hypothetical protein